MTRFAFIFLGLLVIVCVGGCGYHSGFLIPTDVKTVAVRVPVNETFWHEAVKVDNLRVDVDEEEDDDDDDDDDMVRQPFPSPRPAYPIEVDLATRIKNEIARRTPLKVADEGNADSVLVTTITRIEPEVLVRDADDNALSQRVKILVDFYWQDRRSGRIIAEVKGLSRPTDFVVARGETFTTAARTSLDYIAIEIVENMQEGF